MRSENKVPTVGADPSEEATQTKYMAGGRGDINGMAEEGAPLTPVLSSMSSSSEDRTSDQAPSTPALSVVRQDFFPTPSPLLLNPLTSQDWAKSSSRHVPSGTAVSSGTPEKLQNGLFTRCRAVSSIYSSPCFRSCRASTQRQA